MKKDTLKKVAVGLSGGVDSSVAAYLLKEQGYDVTGVYMKCWDKKEDGCASDEDKAYALQTAAKIGINFEQLDFTKPYNDKIIQYFYSEYQAGRTPNPDILCNKEIKFGLFFDWALQNNFDYVATGHYARVKKEKNGEFSLLAGKDSSKDQSYFLYLLDQQHLSKVLFPVGDMFKTQVREVAEKAQLPAFKRPDSQGICFIGEVDVNKFLKERISVKKGDVVNTRGEIIGSHEGVWFYTVGQRHGFDVKKYFGEPLYVVNKDIENNILTVGVRKDVMKNTFEIENMHLISDTYNKVKSGILVRIRHLGEIVPCTLENKIKVKTKRTLFGVSAGQSAVFYKKDAVLGGGVIV